VIIKAFCTAPAEASESCGHFAGNGQKKNKLYDMGKELIILIADRNPHVREFLKREMIITGYRVRLAKSGQEVLKQIYSYEPLDLLILDPDLPDTEETTLLKALENRVPKLPVVFHAFKSDDTDPSTLLEGAFFVEKTGNSIEQLKRVVLDNLKKSDSERS